jgi:uncharacterized membrane protein
MAEIQSPNRDRTNLLIVYILFIVGLFSGGLISLAGLIMAYFVKNDADVIAQTHLIFLIRTFWIGLLFGLVGVVLSVIGVGFLILALATIWYLIRVIKGVITFNRNEPIAEPRSWLFG